MKRTTTTKGAGDFWPAIAYLRGTKSNNGNLKSSPLRAEDIATINKAVREGSSLFLKKATKKDKYGNDFFVLSVAPPQETQGQGRGEIDLG